MGRTAKGGLLVTFEAVDKGVEKVTTGIGDAFKTAHATLGSFEAGLKLAEKAFNGLETAIDATIGKALEFRFSWDPAKKQITEFGQEAERIQARVGDLMVPAIQGAIDVLKPLLDQFEKWIKTNEKLLQQGVIEWLVNVSTALVDGVAKGADLANKAFSGWSMGIHEAEAAMHRLNASQLEDAANDKLEKFGEHGKVAAENLRAAARAEEDAADKAEAAAARDLAAMEGRTAAASRFRDELVEGIGKAGAAAFDHVGGAAARAGVATEALEKRWAAMDSKLDEAMDRLREKMRAEAEREDAAIERALERAKQQQERMAEKQVKDQLDQIRETFGAWSNYYNRKADLAEKTARAIEQSEQASAEIGRSLAGDFVSAWSTAFGQVGEEVDGQLVSAEQAFGNFLKGIAERAAAALAEKVLGGLLGMLVGSLFPPSLLAGGGGLLGGLLGFAEGGLVRGGTPGRDSVPALLTPGEFVLPVHVVEQIRGSAPSSAPVPRFAAGGLVGSGSGGTTNVSINTLALPGSAETYRWMRDVFSPTWNRLQRDARGGF